MDVTRLMGKQQCVGRDNLCRLENKMKENKRKTPQLHAWERFTISISVLLFFSTFIKKTQSPAINPLSPSNA